MHGVFIIRAEDICAISDSKKTDNEKRRAFSSSFVFP